MAGCKTVSCFALWGGIPLSKMNTKKSMGSVSRSKIVAWLPAVALICTWNVKAAEDPSMAPGQAPGKRIVNVNLTGAVTQVPIRLEPGVPGTPAWRVVGVQNLIFCNHATSDNSGAQPGTPNQFKRDTGDLKGALVAMVRGRPVADLRDILRKLGDAARREQKMEILFGITNEPPVFRSRDSLVELSIQQTEALQMGQSVTQPVPQSGTAGGVGPCYTPQQIDQAIAEGTRVVSAIVDAMDKPAKK